VIYSWGSALWTQTPPPIFHRGCGELLIKGLQPSFSSVLFTINLLAPELFS
jgi:hypothetical protein